MIARTQVKSWLENIQYSEYVYSCVGWCRVAPLGFVFPFTQQLTVETVNLTLLSMNKGMALILNEPVFTIFDVI